MDAEKILIAIEEKRKWEARLTKTDEELQKLGKRKSALQRELRDVAEKLKYYTAISEAFREYSVAKASGIYPQEHSRQI